MELIKLESANEMKRLENYCLHVCITYKFLDDVFVLKSGRNSLIFIDEKIVRNS